MTDDAGTAIMGGIAAVAAIILVLFVVLPAIQKATTPVGTTTSTSSLQTLTPNGYLPPIDWSIVAGVVVAFVVGLAIVIWWLTRGGSGNSDNSNQV